MFSFLKKIFGKNESNIEDSIYICPKCMVRMDKKKVGLVVFDKCKTCESAFIEKEEFQELFNLTKEKELSISEQYRHH